MNKTTRRLLALPFVFMACLCILVILVPILLIMFAGVTEGEQYLSPFLITVVFAPLGLLFILLAKMIDPSMTKKFVTGVICGLVFPICVYFIFLLLFVWLLFR